MSMMVSKARGRVQESIMCPSRVTSSLNEFMGPFRRLQAASGTSGQESVLPNGSNLQLKKPAGDMPAGPEMSALCYKY